MPTQGLHVVLCGGRYFMYYHGLYGDPEYLGQSLLMGVPCQLDQYKEWLSHRRADYAHLTAQLEAQVLCVTTDMMYKSIEPKEPEQALELDTEQEPEQAVIDSATDQFLLIQDKPPWRNIEFEWDRLPVPLFDPGIHRYIEYTYIIDLDKELFRFNHWVAFPLWNVPRDRWIEAVSSDGVETFDTQLCPEAIWSIARSAYWNDDTERDTCIQRYREYHITTFDQTEMPLYTSKMSVGQVLALSVFELLNHPFGSSIWDFLSHYDHRSFAFRELAFIVLSLAAGKVRYEMLGHLHGHTTPEQSNGYLVGFNEKAEPQLLSMLGSGSHLLNEEPGSSPTDTMYCLNNVVVSLVPDDVLQNETEAAIAKLITYGRSLNNKPFSAILFSIDHALMMEVDVHDGTTKVRLGQKVQILNHEWFQPVPAKDLRTGVSPSTIALSRLQQSYSGFIALQNFFSMRIQKSLPKCSQGIFSAELYSMILAFADSDTLDACAQVSHQFYQLCMPYAPFSTDLTLLKFNPNQVCIGRPSRKWPQYIDLYDLGTFTFLRHTTGEILHASLDVPDQLRYEDEKAVGKWCPVIGSANRRTIATIVQLRLQFHLGECSNTCCNGDLEYEGS